MKIDSTFLRSRVARRIFLLFLICALIPILALGVVAYMSVRTELVRRNEERLAELDKSLVMAFVERLDLLAEELRLFGAEVLAYGSDDPSWTAAAGGRKPERFRTLAVVGPDDRVLRRSGEGLDPPWIGEDQRRHLDSGFPVLTIGSRTSRGLPVLLGLALRPDPDLVSGNSVQGTLWAEIEPDYLWWGSPRANHLPPLTELCVLDATATRQIFCSHPGESELPREALTRMAEGSLGGFSWKRDGRERLARYRTVRLDSSFALEGLVFVVSEARSQALAPLARYRDSFPLILLGTLCVVLLVSIAQIRKSLIPLEKLEIGTRRLADGEFGSRVEIESGDEFEDLAESFNSMARRLGRQFGALSTQNEIARAVLSSLDAESVVSTVLRRSQEIRPAGEVGLVLMDDNDSGLARRFIRLDGLEPSIASDEVELSPGEMADFEAHRHHLVLDPRRGLPPYLDVFDSEAVLTVACFPLQVKGDLRGLLAATSTESREFPIDELRHLRQMADQVAVALANARLVDELEQLSGGTLKALARTIDAKSHWTQGHSERVARLAVDIGRRMARTEDELEILERGCLVHDIGKIGISSSILDSPKALTPEERRAIQQHVRIGLEILEPISQFAAILPIVRDHHEWFDGGGYPRGVAGEEIHWGARVLAAADIYDALLSARPYREALPREEVIQLLREARGRQLDPKVVDAFLDEIGLT